MIIVISGTPCTGKTSTAKILSKILKARLISISELVKSEEISGSYDKKRKTSVVDEKVIKNRINKLAYKTPTTIVEGHVAHIIDADKTIILRCNPLVLKKRMRKRKWSKAKIKENIEAEILDVITIEALGINKHVVEIDTSDLTPKKIALIIKKLLNNHRLQKEYLPGRIDWTEKYWKMLVKDSVENI